MTIELKDDKQMERAIYWHVRLLSGDFNSQELEEFLAKDLTYQMFHLIIR